MMKTLFAVLMFFTVTSLGELVSTSPAAAGPWCANTSGYGGFVQDCSYYTFGQCLATLQGQGGYCSANTLYPSVGPYPPPPYRKRHARRAY